MPVTEYIRKRKKETAELKMQGVTIEKWTDKTHFIEGLNHYLKKELHKIVGYFSLPLDQIEELMIAQELSSRPQQERRGNRHLNAIGKKPFRRNTLAFQGFKPPPRAGGFTNRGPYRPPRPIQKGGRNGNGQPWCLSTPHVHFQA